MKEKIMQICEELCCREIRKDEQLIETGVLDSYKIMELICSLEMEFHITLLQDDISDLSNFACVDSIAGLICRKISWSEGMVE